MDLFIETKDYQFSLDSIALSFVSIYMMEKLNIMTKLGLYYLTRKEIESMIDYFKCKKENESENDFLLSILDSLIDRFQAMYILMRKNEKAVFKFW